MSVVPSSLIMSGWKTWAAALLSVAYGVVGWLAGVHDLEVAMGFVVAGGGLVGLGHKVEKAAAPDPEVTAEAIARRIERTVRQAAPPAEQTDEAARARVRDELRQEGREHPA